MQKTLRSRLGRSWLLPLCVAAGFVVPADASAITSAECDAQVNDTPGKLIPCIQQDDLWNHMKQFQAIADANPGPRRPSVAQLGRARLQGVGGLRRAEDAGRRIRRHDPAVHVHLLLLRRDADVERGIADRTRASRWSPTGTPGRATGRPTPRSSRPAASSSRRPRPRARRAAAPRLTSAASRGHDRADPARWLQLRREGAQRPGRRRSGRGHLQRGQPRPHRGDQRQPARRQQQPVRPDDPGGVHVVRHRQEPLQRVPGRDAAAHEPQHPAWSSTRTATTTT